MDTRVYDIIVIGGGPAGATFAREAAQLLPDKRILLVNGQSDRHRKVCGGLLAPDAQRMFARFDLTLPKDILADPQIFDVKTIDLAKKRVRHYQRHYLNMDRFAFDNWLLSLVPARVDRLDARCLAVDKNDGGFAVTLLTDAGEQTVSADYLVGADGASSVVRRTLFARQLPRYVAVQQHFRCANDALPPYSCIFDPATSDSCSWTICKDDRVIFGGAFPKQGCRAAFEQQKQHLEAFLGFSLGEPLFTEACQLGSPRRWRDFQTGRDGAFLIGEAAGFISASSFEGISSAVLSGRLLAEAFADGAHASAVAKGYRRRTRKLRLKLYLKTFKRRLLCSPFCRAMIMKSGLQSIEKYDT
ncbi:MAG: FAD-binding protein [Clostridia bacterium]|nr:FAD-binding protein [Clostridia bacterium]